MCPVVVQEVVGQDVSCSGTGSGRSVLDVSCSGTGSSQSGCLDVNNLPLFAVVQ
jgi:hypothetical protein